MWQNTVMETEGTQGKDYFMCVQQDGIIGSCDMNICYKDYPKIIRGTGLNGLKNESVEEVDYKALYEEEKATRLKLVAGIEKLIKEYK